MADRSIIIPSEFVDFDYDMVVDELSVWEFINPSEDDGSDFSFTDDDEEGDQEGRGGRVLTVVLSKEEENGPLEIVGSPSSDISVEMEPVSADVGGIVVTAGVIVAAAVVDDCVDEYGGSDVYGGDDEDYDDYNDGYDLDDELVPWDFSGKYGKQRIRKTAAKKASPRVKGSKKLVYRCAQGKQGMVGLQHRYI